MPVATYATRPDFSNPRVYIPLEAPGALLWYLRTLHVVTDARSWLLNRTLLGIGNASSRVLASCIPDVVVVTRKSVPSDPAVHRTCTSMIADPLLERTLGTTDLHALLISGQRTVVFVFGRESSEPLAVIKIPKLASQNRPTENEYQCARGYQTSAGFLDRFFSPKPLLLLRWRGISVAVESVTRGHSLARTFDTWRCPLGTKIEGLRDAARWLSSFHRSTQLRCTPWNSEETGCWLTTPTDLYRRSFGETDREHTSSNGRVAMQRR